MKKVAFILCMILFVSCLWPAPISAEAVSISESHYGFTYDESKYSFDFDYETQFITFWLNGYMLAQVKINIGVGTLKSSNRSKVLAVRADFNPYNIIKDNLRYYHAVNNEGIIALSLGKNMEITDFWPESAEKSIDKSISLSATVGGGKDGGSASGTAGGSISYKEDSFSIISNESAYGTGAAIKYEYHPQKGIVGSAGKKSINKFLNSTHKEYAIFYFKDNNPIQVPLKSAGVPINLTVTASFALAQSKSIAWDGGVIDFVSSPISLLQRMSMYIYY